MATLTHCPYCAFQCGMRLVGPPEAAEVSGDEAFPVNRGRLCVKGWTAPDTLAHPDRLTHPLIRNEHGHFLPASWGAALSRVVDGIRDAQRRHGRDAVGLYGSGSLTNEKAYLLGKFARVALRTANIDYNGRFCMASAGAAVTRALGVDRGLPFPVADIADADVILIAGGNPAETMPPLMQYFDAQRAAGGRMIVVDPRSTETARAATLHLAATPGTDVTLAHGLVHLLVREGWIDVDFIRRRTIGFDDLRAFVAGYWPARVERVTGIPEAELVEAARILGEGRSVMVLTGRGPEQQSRGVANVLAYINVALCLGAVGRKGGGYGCITGQGNGQGGREHGQKADQLPGYRSIEDPEARLHVAGVWDFPPEAIPGPGVSAYEMLSTLGAREGVRALLVFGSNPAVSAPDGDRIAERLAALDLLVVSDFFLSETAAMADVVFPSAQWAEEKGTMTNLEGRVIRRRRAFPPPSGVRTDIEILSALAERLGAGRHFSHRDEEEVFDELRRASTGGPADYSGITWSRIDRENGVFWPCPDEAHPGTPRLFTEGFPLPGGRARFHAVPPGSPAEEPWRSYPVYLTTGRLLGQYQTGSQTRRVERLVRMAPEPTARMHPALARRHGLAEGDYARVVTRRAGGRFRVEITPGIREDTVFLPFHWGGERSANRLTNPALDPVSRMPEFKVAAARLEKEDEWTPAREAPALDTRPLDSPTLDSPTLDSPTLDSPGLDQPALDEGMPNPTTHTPDGSVE